MADKENQVSVKREKNRVKVEVRSSEAYWNNGNIKQETLGFTYDDLGFLKKSDKYYENKGEELMVMHQEFYRQIDPIQVVLRGAILKCTHSSDDACIRLDAVKDHGVYSQQHAVMTCTDCKVGENIYSFGLCGNEKHEPEYSKEVPCPTETGVDKKGITRHKCIPLLQDEWVVGDRESGIYIYISPEAYEIEPFEEAILTDASLLCFYGGIITIEENAEVEENTTNEAISDDIIPEKETIVTDRLEYEFKYDWMKKIEGHECYVTEDVLKKVVNISQKLDINPDDLMAVMAFESWLSPYTKNSTGACGLIQFTNISLEQINNDNRTNYTKDVILQMDIMEQLDLVYLHLKPNAGKMNDLADVYVAVLAPMKAGNEELYTKKDNPDSYRNNKGLDLNQDEIITKTEAAQKVIERRDNYYRYNQD